MSKFISVVIPLFNEQDTLDQLGEEIKSVFDKLAYDYELIFVDDGSTDNSLMIIKEMQTKDPKIRLLKLRKNFGKSTALSAGFKEARGEIVLTMDADLQDDPREITNFIDKIQEGFDLVSGWKKVRHDPLSKTLPSKLFNKVVNVLTGLKIHDLNCGFKAYRQEVVKNIRVYGEMHRYIPVLAFEKGYKVTEIVVQHHARKFGKSKFGLERFARGLFDAITVTFVIKYSQRPMHFFGILGFLSFALGVLIGLYLTVLWFVGESIGDRPLLILVVILILLGVQFISTGLLAELLVKNNFREDNRVEEIS